MTLRNPWKRAFLEIIVQSVTKKTRVKNYTVVYSEMYSKVKFEKFS